MIALSCSSKKEPIEAKKDAAPLAQEQNPLLREFEQKYKEHMQQFVDFILEKRNIVFFVNEEEKGYYVGSITIKKNYQFEADYGAEPPIGLEVDTYTMDEDKMVIMFERFIVRENNGKIEKYKPNVWELILTKDTLYNFYKPFFEGLSLQGPLEVKAKMIGPLKE